MRSEFRQRPGVVQIVLEAASRRRALPYRARQPRYRTGASSAASWSGSALANLARRTPGRPASWRWTYWSSGGSASALTAVHQAAPQTAEAPIARGRWCPSPATGGGARDDRFARRAPSANTRTVAGFGGRQFAQIAAERIDHGGQPPQVARRREQGVVDEGTEVAARSSASLLSRSRPRRSLVLAICPPPRPAALRRRGPESRWTRAASAAPAQGNAAAVPRGWRCRCVSCRVGSCANCARYGLPVRQHGPCQAPALWPSSQIPRLAGLPFAIDLRPGASCLPPHRRR